MPDPPWEAFDPDQYFAYNYRELRDDDRRIMEIVRDYFARTGVSGARGVDVGTGPNLYPALAMLPYCRSLTLSDISHTNTRWLTGHLALAGRTDDFARHWGTGWELFQQHPAYRVGEPAGPWLARVATVARRSVFDLPRGYWDIGTMFFVACSISTEWADFERAVCCFLGSLVPDAPFAMAFMAHSHGYWVGDVPFPGVFLDVAPVRRFLGTVAHDLQVEEIGSRAPLRPDVGMILAFGRTKG
jgi:hypothetical protein